MNQRTHDGPIRICFVSPKSYPLFNPDVDAVFGGAEVDMYLLGTELADDEGFNVSFVTADYGGAKTETVQGVTIIKSLDFDKNPLSGAVRIWRALRRADADIYMTKTASAGVLLVSLFCRLHGKKFVYRTAHQDECDGTYLKRHPFLGKRFIASLRRAGAVFAQNSVDADNLKRIAGIESTVIPNGHRMPPMQAPGDVPGNAPGTRDSILWVGRSAGFKRPEKFLDLAAMMPDEKFVMVCQRATGDDDYDQLSSRAEAMPNVEFHRRVVFGRIDSFFRRARVLVNTSDSEGFANTFIQACKWATPILSLTVNPDNFLVKHSCGLCCRGDEKQLVDGLKSLLDGDKYAEIGRCCRQYACRNHDVTKIVEQYKDIFCRLVRK